MITLTKGAVSVIDSETITFVEHWNWSLSNGYAVRGFRDCEGSHSVRMHRVIWAAARGAIPDGMEVEHKNTNPLDNRLENLRLATHAENMRNLRLNRTNKLGIKGVERIADRLLAKPYRASIRINGRNIRLGYFASAEEAAAAYAEASKKYHGEFGRTE